MAEQITLYTASEFRRLFDFDREVGYDWLDMEHKQMLLVDARGLDSRHKGEGEEMIDAFLAEEAHSLHPWSLAASGRYNLPEHFLIVA